MTSGSGFVSTGGPRVEKIGHILENIVFQKSNFHKTLKTKVGLLVFSRE